MFFVINSVPAHIVLALQYLVERVHIESDGKILIERFTFENLLWHAERGLLCLELNKKGRPVACGILFATQNPFILEFGGLWTSKECSREERLRLIISVTSFFQNFSLPYWIQSCFSVVCKRVAERNLKAHNPRWKKVEGCWQQDSEWRRCCMPYDAHRRKIVGEEPQLTDEQVLYVLENSRPACDSVDYWGQIGPCIMRALAG